MVRAKFFTGNIFLIMLLCVLILPSLYALFHEGMFVSDDGEWMIIRLSAFYETLRTGEIPVRFIARLNNGYGYPLADFMYPGFLYLGSLIHLLGFSFINTVKIIFGVSMIFSGIWTYLWLQKIFGKIPAFFAALMYVYMPYHLFDLYTRGSIGEILALSLVPFILWQIERKSLVLTSLRIGSLMLPHNTLAFLCIMPLYVYLVLRIKEGGLRKIMLPAVPFIVGLLLSFFFWGPALYDLQYTKFREVTVSDWQQYFANVSLIGYSTLCVFLLGVFYVVSGKDKKNPYKKEVYFFVILGIVSLFISSSLSSFLWHYLPSSIIQFPFRILSVVIVSVAFISAYLLGTVSLKKQIFLGSTLILFTCISSYAYLFPKEFTQKDDMYYISNFSITTVKNEYMPKWVTAELPASAGEKVEIIEGKGSIIKQASSGNTVHFITHLDTNAILQINTVYFPGWIAIVDGIETPVSYKNRYGLIQIPVEKGKHTVVLRFSETPFRMVSNSISLLTLLALGIIFTTKMRYNRFRLQ